MIRLLLPAVAAHHIVHVCNVLPATLPLSASAPRILGVGAAQTWPAASEPRKAKGRKDRDADGQTQGNRGRNSDRRLRQPRCLSTSTVAVHLRPDIRVVVLFFLFPPLPLLPLRASPRATPRYQIKVSYSDDWEDAFEISDERNSKVCKPVFLEAYRRDANFLLCPNSFR